MTPDKETVRAAYIAEIGYDCFETDDMTVQEAWEILQGHRVIAAEAEREYADYQRRARNIDDWARAQYAAGKMSEAQIERRVEHMFDALDAEYMGPCIERVQTRADFHLED